MTLSKNNCQTVSFEHVFIMTFVKRLKFAQNYRVVHGHSLLLYNTLLRKFVWPRMGPLMHVGSCSLTFRDNLSVPCLMVNIWAA